MDASAGRWRRKVRLGRSNTLTVGVERRSIPGMTQSSHLSNVWFSVTPLRVSSGNGCWVTTTAGEEFLDFAAGIAVDSHRPRATTHSQGDRSSSCTLSSGHRATMTLQLQLSRAVGGEAGRADAGRDGRVLLHRNSGAEIAEATVKVAKTEQRSSRAADPVQRQLPRAQPTMAMAMTTSKTGYRAGHTRFTPDWCVRHALPGPDGRRSGRRTGQGPVRLRSPC